MSSKRCGRTRRRGAISVLVVTLLIIFLVAVVFLVDVAFVQLTRVKLRTATDAAARACGETLSRTQDMAQARQAAKDIAALNDVAGVPLTLTDQDIVFGAGTREADGSWTFDANGGVTNAVRIHGRRTEGSTSGSVRLFFAQILGTEYFEPEQLSTVVGIDRDVCLIVDRSGSMKLSTTDTGSGPSTSDERYCQVPNDESRWTALATAVELFVTTLDSTPYDEYLGVVSYASDKTACEVVNNVTDIDQPLDADVTLVNDAMSAITGRVFNGSTNIYAGIMRGVEALNDPNTSRQYALKTLVLFTDGQANQGDPPVDAARLAAQQNIVIHTVTFGQDANQTDMIAVADETGGKHYHAPDSASLDSIFREIALSLSVVFSE